MIFVEGYEAGEENAFRLTIQDEAGIPTPTETPTPTDTPTS